MPDAPKILRFQGHDERAVERQHKNILKLIDDFQAAVAEAKDDRFCGVLLVAIGSARAAGDPGAVAWTLGACCPSHALHLFAAADLVRGRAAGDVLAHIKSAGNERDDEDGD